MSVAGRLEGVDVDNYGEELEDLRRRFQLLEGDRKAFYKTSLNTMQKNKEQIKQLQTENKMLRVELKTRSTASGGTGGTDLFRKSDEQKELMVWRRKVNDSKNSTLKTKKQLKELKDKLSEVTTDRNALNSEENPQMRQIRILENRLDKAMIKYNEAMSIKKTYELIVKRLRDERVGYDNQLAAIEESLKGKEHDHEELLLLSHDAKHAKEMAQQELREFEIKNRARKELRDEEMNHQKGEMEKWVERVRHQEEREKEKYERELEERKRQQEHHKLASATEEIMKQTQFEADKQRLQDYEKALRSVKDATGVSDVNEIIQKFATQDDTYTNLNDLKKENEQKLMQLNKDKVLLKDKVDKLKYEGSDATTRKKVDELEANVGVAQQKLTRNQDKYTRISKILVSVKAGIQHLYEKLDCVNYQAQPLGAINDDTLMEALGIVEDKLGILYDGLKKNKEFMEILAARKTIVIDTEEVIEKMMKVKGAASSQKQLLAKTAQNFNVRVKMREKDDEELSEGDVDDEAEGQANERLKMKHEAKLRLERYSKNKIKKPKSAVGGARTKKTFF